MGTHKDKLPGGINPSRSRLPSGKQGHIIPGGRHGFSKKNRREQADERTAHRSTLTPQQQLDRLNARLGHGVGAEKERARLKLLLNK